jgi:hypothetical protein
MFHIYVCEPRRIVLIRFRGQLSEADFTALDASARATPQAGEYDCIFDFTGVEKAELATDFVSRRGDLPQAFQDRERIYVVAHDDLKLLMRLYAAYQTSKGWRVPVIVEKLDDVFERLGVTLSDFRRRER